MDNKSYAFQPKRINIGFWCCLFFLGILAHIYYLANSSSMLLYVSLFFMIGMFIFLFVPFVKNQRLLIKNQEIIIFSFNKPNKLKFCVNLKEIVVKENEIVSYRFENKGKYYQISPQAYYANKELKELFLDLNERCKKIIAVVDR